MLVESTVTFTLPSVAMYNYVVTASTGANTASFTFNCSHSKLNDNFKLNLTLAQDGSNITLLIPCNPEETVINSLLPSTNYSVYIELGNESSTCLFHIKTKQGKLTTRYYYWAS